MARSKGAVPVICASLLFLGWASYSEGKTVLHGATPVMGPACYPGCTECSNYECTGCKEGHALVDGRCYLALGSEGGCSSSRCLKCKSYGQYSFSSTARKCELCMPGYRLAEGNCYEHAHSDSEVEDTTITFPAWMYEDHNNYDPPSDSGYAVHFSGLFFLPCISLAYLLRILRRARQQEVHAVVVGGTAGESEEVALQTIPPMMVAEPSEDQPDDSDVSEHSRLLGDGAAGADSTSVGQHAATTIVVIDPLGNIEVGKEEKA